MPFTINAIKFGTDGWRGIIAKDFTFARVALLAPIAAQVLAETKPEVSKNLIVIGYDRRFLAKEFAQIAAESVQEAGFDVLLAQDYAPTPAFSWAAKQFNALGALVLTASHNPPEYLGLKVKGAFGGSVSPVVTQKIESALNHPQTQGKNIGKLELFDPWEGYCQELRLKVNIDLIQNALETGKLTLYADVMHGAAATGLTRLLGTAVKELNSNRDALFGGKAPEPLPHNLTTLLDTIKAKRAEGTTRLLAGLAFDGDSDRIAAVDGYGNFLSSQILIPILIDHLAKRRGWTGEIVKTVSGSDLIPLLANFYNLEIFETPIGYKYIADRMLTTQVLIGGEESGGVGYGNHIPERDALLSALYVLEAIVESEKDLGDYYSDLQAQVGFYSSYDRIDLPLKNMEAREKLLEILTTQPPDTIAATKVKDCLSIDGYKFRLADGSWLLIRFSGTEPLLRLYCEAKEEARVSEILNWAKEWATSIV